MTEKGVCVEMKKKTTSKHQDSTEWRTLCCKLLIHFFSLGYITFKCATYQ